MSHRDGFASRKWLRVALALGSIVVSLITVEIALRIAGVKAWSNRTAPPVVWEFSETRHHQLVPDGWLYHESLEFSYPWTNNSIGMRDRERSWEKSPRVFRILFLGDSFVQGHSVRLEDTVTLRLEERLNHPPRSLTYEVWNAGVFGYSPMLESLYLGEILDPVSPDLVLLGFFPGNDIGEDVFYAGKGRRDLSGGRTSFHDEEWPWTQIVNALDEESGAKPPEAKETDRKAGKNPIKAVLDRFRTYRLVRDRIEAFRRDATYRERRQREFALVQDRRGDIRYDLGLVNYPVLEHADRLRFWKGTMTFLSDIHDMCRSRGIPFALVVIPPYERLDGTTEFDEPYSLIEAWGSSSSVPVIQLLPHFQKSDLASIYFPYDRHWTPQGHDLAAEILNRELVSLDLIPLETTP